MTAFGMIGAGHLAGFLIKGWLHAGGAGDEILVSPRGQAAAYAKQFGVRVASDNAAVVAQTKTVLLAVRPAHAAVAVQGLPWSGKHRLISLCAGVAVSELSMAAPARIHRAMPIAAAAIGQSPTALYPPNDEIETLLSRFGPVFPFSNEGHFNTASVGGAVYGWAHALILETADWFSTQGLPPETAQTLASRLFEAAGMATAERPETPIAEVLQSLATPGGITEAGLNALKDRGADAAWRAACAAAAKKMRSRSQ